VAISGREDGGGEAEDEDRLACIALYLRRGPPAGEPLPAKFKSSSQSNCGRVSEAVFVRTGGKKRAATILTGE
jgi:hypothetical protein